jgi:uncharacterized protein YkwD
VRCLGLIAATAIALSPLTIAAHHLTAAMSQPAAPAPLVSASREVESTIVIALVNPTYPTSLAGEADALAADVNRERAKRGISQLARDASLDRFAHAKAVDMAARGYFGHTSPEGITFAERMRAGRWPTAYVGENIAFDRDEPAAHQAFLNSPPHLANVIDPNQRRIGVAVVTVGHNETFYVEDFSQ